METQNDFLSCHSLRSIRFIESSIVLGALFLIPFTPAATAQERITHSFLAFGAKTYLVSDDGKVAWTYPFSTRDGWDLPDGHLLLTLSKSDKFPGGGVV